MNNDEQSENFIRAYPNVLSQQFCKGVIDYFTWCEKNNRTFERTETTSNFKKDTSSNLNPSNFWEISFASENLSGFLGEFNDVFWNSCYNNYLKEFDTLNSYSRHTIFSYKIQKTLPSGGYHVWHCENGTPEFGRRLGVYIAFLNDVYEGGETEFLYQRLRIPPTRGTIVIFPAGFTHTHRGNPPLKGSKYIMTGWIEFS